MAASKPKYVESKLLAPPAGGNLNYSAYAGMTSNDLSQRRTQPVDLRTSHMPGNQMGASFYNTRTSAYNRQSNWQSPTGRSGSPNKVILVDEFNPKEYIMPGVTEKDVEVYKEVFDLFSISGTSLLTPMDLRNAMEAFGYHPKKQSCTRLWPRLMRMRAEVLTSRSSSTS